MPAAIIPLLIALLTFSSVGSFGTLHRPRPTLVDGPAVQELADPANGREEWTVMTYNVLVGFNHHRAETEGAQWIKRQQPDVLALQELNGFTQESLLRLARTWGHHHAVILKEDGFPVGLTSRTPITVLERRTQGMHHGYLHCKTGGIHFIVVHLHPGKYRVRHQEAEQICQTVRPLIDAGQHVMVLGDFNAHSAVDREHLEAKTRLLKRRQGDNLDQGKFDFGVMDRFQRTTLVDIGDRLQDRSDQARATFPTRILNHVSTKANQRQYLERIDFILASPNLVEHCFQASTPHEKPLNRISDHYPCIVKLRWVPQD